MDSDLAQVEQALRIHVSLRIFCIDNTDMHAPDPKSSSARWRVHWSSLLGLHRSAYRAPVIAAAICIAATVVSARFVDADRDMKAAAVADRVLLLVEALFGNYETFATVAGQMATPIATSPLEGMRGYMIGDNLKKQFPAAGYVAFIRRLPSAIVAPHERTTQSELIAGNNGLPASSVQTSDLASDAYILDTVVPAPTASRLGTNLNRDPQFATVLDAARRKRAAVFVPTNSGLTQARDHLPFFLVPVFSPPPKPGAENIVGFLAMAIDVRALMTQALASDIAGDWGLKLGVLPTRTGLPSDGNVELFQRVKPVAAQEAPLRRQFSVADTTLQLEIVPSANWNIGIGTYLPWLIFAVGLFATIMLYLLIRSSQKSQKLTQLLAESRSYEVIEQRRRFRDLVESSSDWIWELDAGFRFRYVSPTTQTLLGYAPEELVGRHIDAVIHDDGAESGPQPMFPFQAESPVAYTSFERMLRHADGRRLVFESAGTPIQDAEGNFAGLRGTDRDMTRQHELRELHSALQQELATNMQQQLVNQLLSGLAHELNQPLATVASYNQACLRMLRQNDINWQEINTAMQASAENALLAGEIVARVRRLAMRQAPDLVPFNVASLVFTTLRFADDQIKLNAVVVSVSMAAPLPQAQGDPIFVTQALLNLLYNAIQALSSLPAESRSIAIETGVTPSAKVFITVRDTGGGVPELLAERIFEPQFTTKSNGMGLGLTISRSIIEVLNGELGFAPNPGGGSAFTITLPMAAA